MLTKSGVKKRTVTRAVSITCRVVVFSRVYLASQFVAHAFELLLDDVGNLARPGSCFARSERRRSRTLKKNSRDHRVIYLLPAYL